VCEEKKMNSARARKARIGGFYRQFLCVAHSLVFAATALVSSGAILVAVEFPVVRNGRCVTEVAIEPDAGTIAQRAAGLLKSRVKWKTGAELNVVSGPQASRLPSGWGRIILSGPHDIEVARLLRSVAATAPSVDELGKEGFFLFSARRNLILIARKGPGFIYGVGKLLHTAKYANASMLADVTEGVEKPVQRTRVLYLATHFNNSYEVWPASAIDPIIEEAALWGVNGISVWLDESQYNDPFNPDVNNADVRTVWKKEKEILSFAQSLGLDPGLVICSNTIYKNQARPAILAPAPPGKGDTGRPLADPTIPEGKRVILEDDTRLFRDVSASGINLKSVLIFPYDTGGCASEACKPWIMTFLKLAKDQAAIVHHYHPSARLYVTDWLCDPEEVRMILNFCNHRKPQWLAGIWEDNKHPFADYAQLGQNYDRLSFQDITMIGGWGAVGANPFPAYFKQVFHHMTDAGFNGYMAYSEGIYDDFNKALTAQLAWNPAETAERFEREYCSYFFNSSIAGYFGQMANLMEDDWHSLRINPQLIVLSRALSPVVPQAEKLASVTGSAALELSPSVRRSWRWRAFALRARIELLAAQLQDPSGFAKQMMQLKKEAVSPKKIEGRMEEKTLQLAQFQRTISELRSGVYKEPVSRFPSLKPDGRFVASATGVSARAWVAALRGLNNDLSLGAVHK
jgi:hypothetical protein